MKTTIAEMVARYDIADGEFITLRYRDGKVHITAANMKVETGDEVNTIIADFRRRMETQKEPAKAKPEPAEPAQEPKKETKPAKARQNYHRWTDEEKREAIKMYGDGVPMGDIVAKFNSTPGSIMKIMKVNGVRRPWPTRGNPSKIQSAAIHDEEPQPEQDPSH